MNRYLLLKYLYLIRIVHSKDLTRIAKINENLWSELFLLNKDILVKDIDSFIETLNEIKNKIKEEDVDSLKEMFKESTKRRKEFEK